MKIFLSVFFGVVAAGLVLYFINLSTIDTQLKVADDAAKRFAEAKVAEEREARLRYEKEQKEREKEMEGFQAYRDCDRTARRQLGKPIPWENVVRSTKHFVAFNIEDESGNMVHYRCMGGNLEKVPM